MIRPFSPSFLPFLFFLLQNYHVLISVSNFGIFSFQHSSYHTSLASSLYTKSRLTSVARLVTMRPSIIAAVLVAPAMIGARPVATPDAKLVLTPDTYSPPDLHGAPMPAEHTAPHHFANGMTDEGLKRMMEGRDRTLATPKEEIITHPYRPFADPTKDRERGRFELFGNNRKVHPRDFRQKVRNTDDAERPPHPNDHHLGLNIGTPTKAGATDNTDRPPHPNGHHLGPNIGGSINARAADYSESMPRPKGHLIPPKIGTPINVRSIDITERPYPNDHHLGPSIGSHIKARAIDNTERPHPNDHHLGPNIGSHINARAADYTENMPRPNGHLLPPKIGTPTNARDIDNTERPPHSNDHHLGPNIGSHINAKREESEDSEEFDDTEEMPVELPISSDYYPDFEESEVFDDLEEMPVELPISSDYYPDFEESEVFDDLEEMAVNLPISSDYYPDFEESEEFDDVEEMPVDLPILLDYYPESSDYEDSKYIPATPGDRNSRRPGRLAGPPYPYAGPLHFNGTGFNNTINGTAFNNATNITTEATRYSDDPTEPILKRREFTDLPEFVQAFEKGRKDKTPKEKADREKARQAAEAEAAKKRKAEDRKIKSFPELFDRVKNPFSPGPPFEEDRQWTPDLFKNLNKPKHPLTGFQAGVENLQPPKDEPGYEFPHAPKPKDIVAETGFDQGDG